MLVLFSGLVGLVACTAAVQRVDTAWVAPPAFGSNGDTDIAAINLSSWAFSNTANTRNNPADAARALAAVDYLAGALSSLPRWDGMSPLTKLQMIEARRQERELLGIRSDTPSQSVVDALRQVAHAYVSHDPAVIRVALRNPIFGRPPDEIAQLLDHLPYLGAVNIATQNASAGAEPGEGSCGLCN